VVNLAEIFHASVAAISSQRFLAQRTTATEKQVGGRVGLQTGMQSHMVSSSKTADKGQMAAAATQSQTRCLTTRVSI